MSRHIATTTGHLEFNYASGTREIFVEAHDSNGDNMLFYLKPYQAAQFAAALEELVDEHEQQEEDERMRVERDAYAEEYPSVLRKADWKKRLKKEINKAKKTVRPWNATQWNEAEDLRIEQMLRDSGTIFDKGVQNMEEFDEANAFTDDNVPDRSLPRGTWFAERPVPAFNPINKLALQKGDRVAYVGDTARLKGKEGVVCTGEVFNGHIMVMIEGLRVACQLSSVALLEEGER